MWLENILMIAVYGANFFTLTFHPIKLHPDRESNHATVSIHVAFRETRISMDIVQCLFTIELMAISIFVIL